jgi:hypothetical protein
MLSSVTQRVWTAPIGKVLFAPPRGHPYRNCRKINRSTLPPILETIRKQIDPEDAFNLRPRAARRFAWCNGCAVLPRIQSELKLIRFKRGFLVTDVLNLPIELLWGANNRRFNWVFGVRFETTRGVYDSQRWFFPTAVGTDFICSNGFSSLWSQVRGIPVFEKLADIQTTYRLTDSWRAHAWIYKGQLLAFCQEYKPQLS